MIVSWWRANVSSSSGLVNISAARSLALAAPRCSSPALSPVYSLSSPPGAVLSSPPGAVLRLLRSGYSARAAGRHSAPPRSSPSTMAHGSMDANPPYVSQANPSLVLRLNVARLSTQRNLGHPPRWPSMTLERVHVRLGLLNEGCSLKRLRSRRRK